MTSLHVRAGALLLSSLALGLSLAAPAAAVDQSQDGWGRQIVAQCKKEVTPAQEAKWRVLKVGVTSQKAARVNSIMRVDDGNRYTKATRQQVVLWERGNGLKANGVVSAVEWCAMTRMASMTG